MMRWTRPLFPSTCTRMVLGNAPWLFYFEILFRIAVSMSTRC